ncbi:MAG: isochorismate synthase [Polaribacter sp.]
MNDDSLSFTESFTENGFVFAPFESSEKAVLFSNENSEFLQETLEIKSISSLNNDFISSETSKQSHIRIVEKAINTISENELQKVVLSRKEVLEITDLTVLGIYKKLLQTYANAFVYVWFHPKVGLWFGATPETLLNINGTSFETMSLAGTQVLKKDEPVVWKTKELEEQQLVTNFIENKLIDIATDLQINKIETVKAGSLLHLKTKVSGTLKANSSNLKTLIRVLHPTPAVCGLPREKAKDFILKNENYNRSFYTGFLGELNIKNSTCTNESSSLFVNLRCMSVKNNEASIYIGGGITKDSNAENEWQETVYKAKTMKRVLSF